MATESPMEPFSISLKIAYRPCQADSGEKTYFVPPVDDPAPPAPLLPAPDAPPELDVEPGMPDLPADPDEPAEPAVPLEPEVAPEVPEAPDDAPPASSPRWHPVVTNTALNNATASIDLEVLDIALIFIPFRNFENPGMISFVTGTSLHKYSTAIASTCFQD